MLLIIARKINMYKPVMFNGQPSNKNWLGHFDLIKGGTINFTMGAQPNKNRGVTADAFPYSFSTSNPGFK
jgi:putative alpha-1,2-mannosidase